MPVVLASVCSLLPGAHAAADGSAAPRAKVVVVSMTRCCPSAAWPEAEAKVAVELGTIDIRVERIDGVTATDPNIGNRLAAALDDQVVVGALRIIRTDNGSAIVELLYRDRRTNKAVSKRLTFDRMPGNEGLAVAALKIVELLTAGALELAGPNARPIPVDLPSSAVAAPAAQPTPRDAPANPVPAGPRLTLKLGVGAATAPGNVTLLPAGFLAVNVAFTKRLSVEADGSISLPGRTVPLGDTKVDFNEGPVRLWVLWELLQGGRFSGTVGAGVGVVIVDVYGHTTASKKGVEDLALTGYAGATLRLANALTDVFTVGLAVNAGAALPKMDIFYSPADAAAFGRPLVEAAVMVGVKIR